MTTKDFDTREALLRSAREEFLAHGFEGASLRSICARAHVTTGAFYNRFESKAAIFSALVDDELADYLSRYDGLMASLVRSLPADVGAEARFMDYLMEHRDLFRLLFECSQGTEHEGFREHLIERFEESYQRLFDAYAVKPVAPEITRVVVRMKFAQYCELLFGGYTRDEVREMMQRLQELTWAEFEVLTGRGMRGSA